MKTLPPSASPFHVLQGPPPLGETYRIGLPVRDRNRQQKIDWYAKRPADPLMQRKRDFALSCFEIGEIALGDADRCDQFGLRHGTPLAQHTDRILSARQPIDNSLGQQDFTAGRDLPTRITYDAGGADIFIGKQLGQPLILALRKDRELLAARSLDELNLRHGHLSIVNLPAMTDSNNDDRVALGVEDDAPIADTQPETGAPFESPYVALTRLRESQELGVEPPANIGGETEPLTRGSGSKDDLHSSYIAKCDIEIKDDIANRNGHRE